MDRHKLALRFSDFDAASHVHNAVYLQYFEQGRISYFRNHLKLIDWDWEAKGVVIARNEIDYRKPILFTSRPVIETSLGQVGGKSFELTYRIIEEGTGDVYAQGKSVQVCFNHKTKETCSVFDEWLLLFGKNK